MRKSAACVLALLSLATRDASATLLTPIDFGELVASSRAILHGQVVDVRSRRSNDRLRAETLVTLQVATNLKGDLGKEVTFVVPGGTVGRYRTIVVGAPSFREGEEVVLFLGANGPTLPYLTRLGQGVFRVVSDPRSNERMIAPDPLTSKGDDWRRVVRGEAANEPTSLATFATRVRALAGNAPVNR